MFATITDADGHAFEVRLPFSVAVDDDTKSYQPGDVICVSVDDGMEHDEDDEAYKPSYAVVCQVRDDKVDIAWMYHYTELSARGRDRRYTYYLTDHYDTVDEDTIEETTKLPDKLAPTVAALSAATPAVTELNVETFIACTVTAAWVADNGIDDVYLKAPGHAQHYREEWAEWTGGQRSVAMFFAKQMYGLKSQATELAKCVSIFEAEIPAATE